MQVAGTRWLSALRVRRSTQWSSAVSSERGELLLFGSHVSPEPGQTRIFPALAVPNNRLEENGLCIAAGDSLTALWEKIENYRQMYFVDFMFFFYDPPLCS